jgi:hypothetical protein
MPTPDQNPSGFDPAHIWAVCASAAPARDRHGAALLAGMRDGVHVYMPTRAGARTAEAALSRVGYQVVRTTDHRRGGQLMVRGWSADGLEARLIAMRAVLEQLASDPGSTAMKALDRLGGLPAAALPDRTGQRQLSRQAATQLLRWIFATSGIHAPHDPLARPADAGCGLRLSTAWQLEEAIEDLAGRQVRVTADALAQYPVLRQQMGHDSARDIAVRRAGVAFYLSSRVAQDTTQILGNGRQTPGGGTSGRIAAATRALPSARPGIPSGAQDARVYPFAGAPASPARDRPPGAAARTRGRSFPSGRAGRHP